MSTLDGLETPSRQELQSSMLNLVGDNKLLLKGVALGITREVPFGFQQAHSIIRHLETEKLTLEEMNCRLIEERNALQRCCSELASDRDLLTHRLKKALSIRRAMVEELETARQAAEQQKQADAETIARVAEELETARQAAEQQKQADAETIARVAEELETARSFAHVRTNAVEMLLVDVLELCQVSLEEVICNTTLDFECVGLIGLASTGNVVSGTSNRGVRSMWGEDCKLKRWDSARPGYSLSWSWSVLMDSFRRVSPEVSNVTSPKIDPRCVSNMSPIGTEAETGNTRNNHELNEQGNASKAGDAEVLVRAKRVFSSEHQVIGLASRVMSLSRQAVGNARCLLKIRDEFDRAVPVIESVFEKLRSENGDLLLANAKLKEMVER